MKEVISNMILKALKEEGISLKKEEIEKFIEKPPTPDMGDYAFPCFFLAGITKIPPNEIALNIRSRMENFSHDFEDIQTIGPYLNFFINREFLASNLIARVKKEKDKYCKLKSTGKKTMVEFPSPNTNKPLHLGHLRNMAIGESVSRISEFNGEKIIRANLYNDRGIHICKSMAAYKLYGKNKTPNRKNATNPNSLFKPKTL